MNLESRIMLRSIFSFFAIIAFALSFILAPAKALACEDPPPTLLALYNKSSEIHVARFEGKDDGNIVEQGEEFTAVEVHKRFSIISSLKGSLQGAFVSTDVEYRYKGIEQTETTDAEETGHGHDPNALAPGDNVLLFLRRSAEGNSLVLADYQGAAKKLSEKELRSYTKAVEDLNSIYAMSKGRDEAIVQWLVERAIDPVTRREGANELLTGFNTIDWKEMRDREIKEKIARGEELENGKARL